MLRAIMFHHFHDENRHIKCQGSLNQDEFRTMITRYAEEHTIVSSEEFCNLVYNEKWDTDATCLSFDDTLRCQYDVALPVLDELGIKAFWFLNSLPLNEGILELEIFHHFRFSQFSTIDQYYDSFFSISKKMMEKWSIDYDKELENFDYNRFKPASKFYTYNDKKYRYIRDVVLGKQKYREILFNMMKEKKYDYEQYRHLLWIGKNEAVCLQNSGHIIGLHSYSHPTTLDNLSYNEQLAEFSDNKKDLELMGINVFSASYPCNSFNADTIRVMRELGIRIAFTANMDGLNLHNALQLPRINHTYLLKNIVKGGSDT